MPSVTSSCGVSLSVSLSCLILAAENLDWKMRLIYTEVNQEFKALRCQVWRTLYFWQGCFFVGMPSIRYPQIVACCQNNVNLLNLGHKHLKPPKTVLKPECVPSKTISLLKTIAAFLWGESIVFTNFYTNMDNINAKSISFCMTISIYKG